MLVNLKVAMKSRSYVTTQRVGTSHKLCKILEGFQYHILSSQLNQSYLDFLPGTLKRYDQLLNLALDEAVEFLRGFYLPSKLILVRYCTNVPGLFFFFQFFYNIHVAITSSRTM